MVVIAALASLFHPGSSATLNSEGRSRRALAAITGIAVLSYLHSLIDFSLQIPGYLIVFGILLGCGLARASAEAAAVAAEPDTARARPISDQDASKQFCRGVANRENERAAFRGHEPTTLPVGKSDARAGALTSYQNLASVADWILSQW